MLIKRLIFDEIQKVLDTNKIIILRGPRQVGKTTIMKDLQTTFKSQKTVFLDMDDLDIKEKIKTAGNLINYIKFEYSYQENEDIVIFLDEFQNIENAGVFLKNIYDKYSNIKLICSGSSSLEITKNIEHLTGRKIVFDITPFTFKEYLKARKFKNYNIKFNINNFNEINDFYNIYQNELENFLKEYLTIGGYPEIVLTTGNIRKNIAKDITKHIFKKI
ncbi:ATP-binding protein [Candidatus Vampirococcus lugosii]|uniref:ATPase, AAA+ superfamily n=1 Tax=Candidatus Vampirococcus lugosii TaxID=2789015 RepID=A0ABS5QJW1_9BACT|nr:AAA family ATPase [Candidatus Vampirococcus lugosii]MBS8121550.1 putative ATPase, AAA+ superfamily [Candidatus Vampirococcus lugosii]